MSKKLFSHTAIYGIAPQISKVAGFFALPIITKYLTDLDYGVYGVLMSYTAAVSVLSILGLRLILINSFYHSPEQYKWYWRQLYGFLNVWNVLYSIVLGLLLYVIMPSDAQGNIWLIIFLNVGPFLFFGQTSTIGLTYYQMRQKPLQIALRTGIFGFLSVALNLFFIAHWKMGYMGWFWTNFIVGILTNLSYWYPLNIIYKISPIYNFKWRLIKRSLRVSLPVVPHHYTSYLVESSDRMVMDVTHVSVNDIGKYNIAYNIGTLFSALANALGLSIGPLMNERFKKQDDTGARNLVFMSQIVFFFLTFVASIWLKEVFQLMVKNDVLSRMYYLAIIIGMSYNYRPMYLGAVNKLFYTENTGFLWKLTLTAGLINLVLNFTLIPFWGFEVAAYTTYVALMFMGYVGFYMKSFKKINTVKYYQEYWFIATILLTVLAYYLVEQGIIVKIAITIFCVAVTTVLLNLFKMKKSGL